MKGICTRLIRYKKLFLNEQSNLAEKLLKRKKKKNMNGPLIVQGASWDWENPSKNRSVMTKKLIGREGHHVKKELIRPTLLRLLSLRKRNVLSIKITYWVPNAI